jgi:ribose transport system ATP-binding protein
MSESCLLEVRGVTKLFPGTVALDEMDFDLERGEVHAIVGENGAGKSTLMKILSGAYAKSSGKIVFQGRAVEIGDSQAAHELGISMIYQEMENVPKLSVAENIFLGRLPGGRLPGFVSFRQLHADADRLLQEYSVDIRPNAQLSRLTTAQQQFVEIIKAVTVKNAKVVIMDEPTSSLIKEETDKLFEIIRELQRRGISVIYISHRLDEVTDIADRISVFRDGKNRGTLKRGEFDRTRIITLMVGHAVESAAKPAITRQRIVFEIRGLSIRNRIKDFNLKLYEGEILGIAGLMGSGKDELVKSLFGLWPATSKEIHFLGERIRLSSPLDAIRYGIVYLPEERKLQSLFLELSVKDNILALWTYHVYTGFFLNNRLETRLAASQVEGLSIKTPSVNTEVVNLSGGNQQKAILSRLMTVKPRLLILNDPTRGVDVKSKEAIYRIIRELSNNGVSILFLSSEIPEIAHLANRVVVLSKGEHFGEFVDDQVTAMNILRAAMRA